MRGHGSQWFSHKMNNRHPLQLKKSKSWEPFGSYQLNSTANPAHLPQNRPNFEVNGLDWQCCLAGSSQRAPRIFIFSIVLGAECLSYLKSIETHARAFSRLISDGISGVRGTFSSFMVINSCDVTFNMSTAVRIKLQTEKCFFIHPLLVGHSVFISYFDVITYIKMNNIYN